MKREILFRGKRMDNGEWVVGDLVHNYWIGGEQFLNTAIRYLVNDIYSFPIAVYPDTIGQFTGLTDKNGIKIFEGDIVKWGHVDGGREKPIRIAEVKINPSLQFDIVSHEMNFLGQNKVFDYGSFIYKDTKKWLEVIGNIHDNPQFLTNKTE